MEELGKTNPAQGTPKRPLTPETISAAYARISRSPLPVNKLRGIARKEVEKARDSNRKIIFGMGHGSIAEHAVFNVDVLGVSRLLVEAIESFRLCSFTEKSQRYVLMEDDFVVPREIKDAGLDSLFIDTVKEQHSMYHDLFDRLRVHTFEKHKVLAQDSANHLLLEGWAKEDARYIISLATETQLGMTLNSRNLELMLRRTAAHPLEEVREYSRRLYEITAQSAPSLVRYVRPTEYELETKAILKETVEKNFEKWGEKKWDEKKQKILFKKGNVSLCYATPRADELLVAMILYTSSAHALEKCLGIALLMDRAEKEEIVKQCCRHMKAHDAALREFENIDLCFDLIVSASCFAQLKRHRMATLHCQEYDPALGVTIPPAIVDIGMLSQFREVISHTEKVYEKIKKAAPSAAAYILTNAHRRRVSLKINAREMYHIARLRTDKHAQWDIRETSERLLALGRRAMPLAMMLATGKDGFAALHDRSFHE